MGTHLATSSFHFHNSDRSADLLGLYTSECIIPLVNVYSHEGAY
jgi:hypothetical protein